MGALKRFLKAKRMKSKGTAKNYLTGINYFLKCLGYYTKTGNERNIEELDTAAEAYLEETRQKEINERKKAVSLRTPWSHVYIDLQEFIYWLKDRGLSGGTINNHTTAVRSFLAKNDIHLDTQKYQEKVDQPKARTISWDKKLTKEQFQKVLSHARIKGKALFLFMISSGIRISGALNIEISELALEKDPPRAYLRGGKTKTGRRRIVFFSNEAKKYLEEWLNHRYDFLEHRKIRSKNVTNQETSLENPRVFPMHRTTANKIWNRLLAKAELDKKDDATGRRIYHLHTLRKFFKSEAQKEIPKPIVEAMIGHKQGLDKAYSRYSEEELAEFYKEIEGRVSVFSTPVELNRKVEAQKEKIETLEKKLDEEKREKQQREEKIKSLYERVNTLSEQMKMFAKIVNKEKKD